MLKFIQIIFISFFLNNYAAFAGKLAPLEAMQTFGVKVYFVNKKQFKKFLSLPGEKQNDYLKNLKPEITQIMN